MHCFLFFLAFLYSPASVRISLCMAILSSRLGSNKQDDAEAHLLGEHIDEATLQHIKEEYWRRKFQMRWGRQRKILLTLFLFSMIFCLILFIVFLSRIVVIFQIFLDFLPILILNSNRGLSNQTLSIFPDKPKVSWLWSCYADNKSRTFIYFLLKPGQLFCSYQVVESYHKACLVRFVLLHENGRRRLLLYWLASRWFVQSVVRCCRLPRILAKKKQVEQTLNFIYWT